MKLEVGMYVRTKDGFIRRYITVDLEDIDEYELDDFILNEYGDWINWLNEAELEKYISKASHNIIDLIEEGDYVNGYQVTSKDQFLGFGNHDWYMLDNEIKSIVTKEQFEAIKYEI